MRYFLFFFTPIFLLAQSSGVFTGKVIESKSGEALPGVNVMVKGTYYGTATDLDGRFIIKNINPGSYDVEVSMIGYKVILQTGVKIQEGSNTELNFSLDETVLSFGEDVIVLGKKPLFDVNETSSVARVRKEEIENKNNMDRYFFI